MIENIQTNLNDMTKLKQHLDFDPFIEIKEKNLSVETLLKDSIETTKKFENQKSKVEELITANDDIVKQFNKKLLYLDSIISLFERKSHKK